MCLFLLSPPRFSPVLVIAALAAIGCSTEPAGCDICTTSAILYGSVRDTAGQPIAGASITASAFKDSCTNSLPAGSTNTSPITDALGNYRGQMLSLYGPFHACLQVTAHAPTGSPWRDTTGSGKVIDFRSDFPVGPHDSVRVDLVLAQ
jgi:hypothetical protein